MKVLLINGQNHKGSTYHIGRILAEKLTLPAEIDEIFLPRDMPHFCCGCSRCFMEGESLCPHYETTKPLTERMDEADVLIFTSPVYVYHATGSMKAFLDHYGYRWMVHRPEAKMFGKQAVVISTAAGAGMKPTCKDIADSCFFWGIGKIYRYGLAVHAIKWSEVSAKKRQQIEKKTSQLASKIKDRARSVKPSLKTKGLFKVMSIAQKRGFNPADKAYWEEKGWSTGSARPWKDT